MMTGVSALTYTDISTSNNISTSLAITVLNLVLEPRVEHFFPNSARREQPPLKGYLGVITLGSISNIDQHVIS